VQEVLSNAQVGINDNGHDDRKTLL